MTNFSSRAIFRLQHRILDRVGDLPWFWSYRYGFTQGPWGCRLLFGPAFCFRRAGGAGQGRRRSGEGRVEEGFVGEGAGPVGPGWEFRCDYSML